jgi:hypothetical protein
MPDAAVVVVACEYETAVPFLTGADIFQSLNLNGSEIEDVFFCCGVGVCWAEIPCDIGPKAVFTVDDY